MNLDFAPLVFSLVAIALVPLFVVLDVVRGVRLRATMKRVLEQTGLRAEVAWMLPVTLSGNRDGLPLDFRIDVARPLPGKSEVSGPTGTLVAVPASGGDVLVCRRTLSDEIVGPLPALPRHRTGDAAFDAAFDVFSTDAGFDASSFPSPGTRAALLQLGLMWLRRKDGRLELFLESMSPNQAEAAVSVATTLARSDGSRAAADDAHYRRAGFAPDAAMIPVPRGDAERFATRHVSWPLALATFVALIVAIPGGAVLPLVPAVHTALADIACDRPGDEVMGTRSEEGDGTSYGVVCRSPGGAFEPTSDALGFACAGFAASVPLALGLLLTLRASLRLLRRPRPAG